MAERAFDVTAWRRQRAIDHAVRVWGGRFTVSGVDLAELAASAACSVYETDEADGEFVRTMEAIREAERHTLDNPPSWINRVDGTDPCRWLRDRADSYFRDSVALREQGDTAMAVAYQAIAVELRKCAQRLEGKPCRHDGCKLLNGVCDCGANVAGSGSL